MRDDERSGERSTRKEYAGEEKREATPARGRRGGIKREAVEAGGAGDRGIQLQ